MADINSVVVKIKDALTEAETVAGGPTTADTIASLQAQLAALQSKYDTYTAAVRAAAQADKDADDAKESGQGVLDIPV